MMCKHWVPPPLVNSWIMFIVFMVGRYPKHRVAGGSRKMIKKQLKIERDGGLSHFGRPGLGPPQFVVWDGSSLAGIVGYIYIYTYI